MQAFTIDTDNNITEHASRKAARETGLGVFTSEESFADLIGPDAGRLVAIWNSLPGVKPVEKFKNRKTATERIFRQVAKLFAENSAAATPAPKESTTSEEISPAENSPAKSARKPRARAQGAAVAPAKARPTKKATRGAKAAKPPAGEPRTGTKISAALELLKRPEGVTLAELMLKFGWQQHSVRGFIAGALKKAGHTVESFKPEGGERTYRIAS